MVFWLVGALGVYSAAVTVLAALARHRKTRVYRLDDGRSLRFFITGDKHRDFSSVRKFCRRMRTRYQDVLIVLGDAGFNYHGDRRDDRLKARVSRWHITLFCLHGNKENRPENVGTYGVRSFCGGRVYYEPRYPNILFAMDGELYDFAGAQYLAVGGAHSVDKLRCLEEGLPFWEDEMPNRDTKVRVEQQLAAANNRVFGMLTHTCPIQYLPREVFVSTRQNAEIRQKLQKAKSKKFFAPDIDRSTEEWLGELEQRLDYQVWYCGHYHVDKQLDKVCMLHHEIRPLLLGSHV